MAGFVWYQPLMTAVDFGDHARRLGSVVGTLRLQRAPEQIADRMLAAIVVGVLAEGERLPSERQLTLQLGVSRETVRSALRRLVTLGVVETRRGRRGGTFVKAPPEDLTIGSAAILRTLEPVWRDMELLLDLRSLVHSLIGATAAERRKAEHLIELRSSLVQYRAAEDASESRRADHRLHDAVAAATGNPYLVDLGQRLIASANLGFGMDPWTRELHASAAEQHARLIDAIDAHDSALAGSVSVEHFQVTSTAPWRELLEEARRTAPASD